jgi:RNA polymerase sigma factor (TIGR02999 family)
MTDPASITVILKRLREKDEGAAEDLMPIVYDRLRDLAGSYMQKERANHTLQATALVSEAYLRLLDGETVDFADRAHFFAVAAQAMRRILIDHARRKKAGKRGGDWDRVVLDAALASQEDGGVDILELNEALTRLSEIDGRKAKAVELRFFGGMTNEETARALGVAPKTAEADWYFARAWLRRELGGREEQERAQ